MKIKYMKQILILILASLVVIAGCSSIDKAKSLHQKGQTEKALKMAQDLLDDDEDQKTRLSAIALIGEIGGDRAGEILMPVLDDRDMPVKNAAIKTIGKIGYAPASQKLLSIALSSKGDTFEAAAGAIRDIGSPAIDLLVKGLTLADDAAEKERYKKLMLAVGPSVTSSITKNLRGKTYFENRTNFELLVAFKSPEVAEWLLKEIGNDEVADNIMEGLVKLGSRAVSPVTEKLRDLPPGEENTTVRIRLIVVLGQLKAKEAVGLLESLTQDNSDRVRDAADLALRRIRGF